MRLFTKISFFIFLLSAILAAKGVPAGTKIVNVAQLNYKVNGSDFNATSNTLVDVVDQVLDLELVCQSTQNTIVQNGEVKRALPFVLENTGNGTDNFSLIPDTNASSPEVDNRLIYLDDGDGVFNSADVQINDINLTADAKATLFFVSDIPASTTWDYSHNGIEARSTIGGSGIPGKDYNVSNGTNNYYAVDGYKGGVDSALCTYQMNHLELQLEKSATLSSQSLFTGTVVHYKIVATVKGEGAISNIVIKDVIPAGTTFQPGSIKLDGTGLADSGHFTSNTISVPVNDMTQTDMHSVEFDVKVD
ncbi:hypothetical protein [Sulfurovum sp.]|uniref:hypothetical protein n=1 Tax=Sulfurovum sp. TaxID=1969726 RepID=UPI0025F52E53|nr:hypothetical protein [Sulfurovum sp.]